MNIALKLQELLDSKRISRSKLAKEIGVHTSTVSNWLDGKDPKPDNLTALCSYFECSLDYLTDTTEKKENAPSEDGASESRRAVQQLVNELGESELEEARKYLLYLKSRSES